MKLLKKGITARQIMTRKAFESIMEKEIMERRKLEAQESVGLRDASPTELKQIQSFRESGMSDAEIRKTMSRLRRD